MISFSIEQAYIKVIQVQVCCGCGWIFSFVLLIFLVKMLKQTARASKWSTSEFYFKDGMQ